MHRSKPCSIEKEAEKKKHILATMDALLDILKGDYGLPIGVAVVVIVLGVVYLQVAGGGGGGIGGPPNDAGLGKKILLHPDHVKYMEEKEEKYCSKHVPGKGMRCIIDYLREDTSPVDKIWSTPPKFEDEELQVYELFIHPPQIEWFETKGIKVDEKAEKGEDRYKEISRVMRASFDWAMKLEADGDCQDPILFEEERCVNCGF